MTLPHTYRTFNNSDGMGSEVVVREATVSVGLLNHLGRTTQELSTPTPKGADAVALAKAFLEAAGDTGHVVIPQDEIDQLRAERDRARRARNRYQDERNDERQRAALLRVAYHAAKSAIPDAPERGTPLTADTDA